MKRSFLSRFLEDEEDEPAPKDTAERIKEARFHFMERVFGICDADPKKGREASSVIHPQSPFATGPQPPLAPSRALSESPRSPRQAPPRRLRTRIRKQPRGVATIRGGGATPPPRRTAADLGPGGRRGDARPDGRGRGNGDELPVPVLLGVRGADAALLLGLRRPLQALRHPLHRHRRRHLLHGPPSAHLRPPAGPAGGFTPRCPARADWRMWKWSGLPHSARGRLPLAAAVVVGCVCGGAEGAASPGPGRRRWR
jgi:hypothetical protein